MMFSYFTRNDSKQYHSTHVMTDRRNQIEHIPLCRHIAFTTCAGGLLLRLSCCRTSDDCFPVIVGFTYTGLVTMVNEKNRGRARYLSVTEAPHNTDFHTWMGEKHLILFNRRDREPNPELWRERQRC